jgi:hypothetical protein
MLCLASDKGIEACFDLRDKIQSASRHEQITFRVGSELWGRDKRGPCLRSITVPIRLAHLQSNHRADH